MVDLPLGATEDRVCGTIDIEKALTEGVKAFEPGLLVRLPVTGCMQMDPGAASAA
jgi:Mg-chelatase subunit ChlI